MALLVCCSLWPISLSGNDTSCLDSGTTRISPTMFCDLAGMIHTRTLAVTSKTKILRERSFGILFPPPRIEPAYFKAGELLSCSELRAHRHGCSRGIVLGLLERVKMEKFIKSEMLVQKLTARRSE